MSKDVETADSTKSNTAEEEIEPKSKLVGHGYLRSLLMKKTIILIKDGRVLKGKFHCTDNKLNIILEGCDEYQSVAQLGEKDSKQKRFHSLLIVPERYIDKVFVVNKE